MTYLIPGALIVAALATLLPTVEGKIKHYFFNDVFGGFVSVSVIRAMLLLIAVLWVGVIQIAKLL